MKPGMSARVCWRGPRVLLHMLLQLPFPPILGERERALDGLDRVRSTVPRVRRDRVAPVYGAVCGEPPARATRPGVPKLRDAVLGAGADPVDLGLRRLLAYFTNFVLLASFLGIGVGFLRSRTPEPAAEFTPRRLAILAGFSWFSRSTPAQLDRADLVTGILGLSSLPRWVMLTAKFLLVVAAMAFVARRRQRFELFEPLEAYRLDILGSLAGIVVFSPPCPSPSSRRSCGGDRRGRLRRGSGAAARVALSWAAVVVLILLVQSVSQLDRWSPYYRVTVAAPVGRRRHRDPGQQDPASGGPAARPAPHLQPFYASSRTLISAAGPPGGVLIIGAGNGNDVAVALTMGAKHVDAVEIDPVLSTGRKRPPRPPVPGPAGNRAHRRRPGFMGQTTRVRPHRSPCPTRSRSSPAIVLRLENYLFTEEAMRDVRD